MKYLYLSIGLVSGMLSTSMYGMAHTEKEHSIPRMSEEIVTVTSKSSPQLMDIFIYMYREEDNVWVPATERALAKLQCEGVKGDPIFDGGLEEKRK